jgi:hypothetical protein
VALGFGGLLALLVVAAFVLTWIVDPNLYRGPIERQVAAATGRAMRLQGDIELAFFPWLSLTSGAAELPSPAGFPEPRFLRWRSAHVGVRLLPLLRGKLVVDRVRLVGLEAHFVKAADGRVNWSLGGKGESAPGAPPDIAGLELRDARVVYDDVAGGLQLSLDDLWLDVEPIREGEPMRVAAAATLTKRGLAERVQAKLNTRLTTGAPLVLAETVITGTALDGRFGVAGAPWRFEAPRVSFDPASGTLETPEWLIGFGKARLQGAMTATLGEKPGASGSLALAPVSLRETLAAAGIELPPTRDPAVWSGLKADAAFRWSVDAFRVEPLAITLDDTRISGHVEREEGVLRFALHGDRMDLGRYLKPEGTPSEPFVLPIAALKAMRVSGTFDLDEATLDGVKMKGVRLGAGP